MKLGLLGYGFMGGVHLAALQRIEGVTVPAVASRMRPSADGPSRGNMNLPSGPLPDSVRWSSDWRQVVRDPTIDAVDICLPTNLHKEIVIEALNSGKHVLCEKPMALSASDCDDILAAAAKSSNVFMVGQVLRFMSPYRYAASFLREVGRDAVTGCTLQRSTGYPDWGGWLAKEECSGGAILDLLSHDLEQALSLFGPPASVSATSRGPVDTMNAVLRYEDGLVVNVDGGWYSSDTPFNASFCLEAGEASLTFHDGKLVRHANGREDEAIALPEEDPYYREIAYFVDCCRCGVSPELCPPAESARTVYLANLLRESREQSGKELSWQA